MAWNGRNESILGAKAADDIPADVPSKKVVCETDDRPQTVEAKKVAPAPPKSVWNGRHQKIMGIKDKSRENIPPAAPVSETSSVASAASPARSMSPSVISTASGDSKKELLIGSPAKDADLKALQPLEAHSKEDETTNSTAGSSTTNTTIADEEQPNALEVKVVTTVPSNTEKNDSSEGANDAPSLTDAAPAPAPAPERSNSKLSSSKNNTNDKPNRPSSGQAKNGQSNGGANANTGNNAQRRGNNKGGGRGNPNSNANSGNNVGRSNNYSKSSNPGGNNRRRANNNADKPVCTFFLRGMCNRGKACSFRHDATQPPPSPTGCPPASPSRSPFRRSGTYPPQSKGGSSPKASGPYIPSKRVFDPHKARAIQLAKDAQDREDRSRFASTAKRIQDEKKSEEEGSLDPPILSIDVECIATGYGSCAKGINDGCGNSGREGEGVPSYQYNERSHRYPGRVAMVDSEGRVLADIVIRPPKDGAGVVSYLTPLTGLTSEMCLGPDAKSLEEAIDIVKGLLSKDAVLVGQAIDHDVEWLGLVPGKDFERMLDISEIFRQRMPSVLGQAAGVLKKKEEEGVEHPAGSSDPSSDEYLGFATRYRHFSLRHVCLNLLGEDIQSGVHDPIVDAKYSLALFHKYRNSSVTQLRIVRDGLHRAPITPGFAAENTPVIDGVCVSAAGYPYKQAARKIWRWYSGKKQGS